MGGFTPHEAAILHWYGSKEKFTDYVRGPLASELIRNLTNRSSHLGYGLIIVTAPVSAGLEQCLSLWMGQAPPEALVSRFLGMVVGTDFFLLLLSFRVGESSIRTAGQVCMLQLLT